MTYKKVTGYAGVFLNGTNDTSYAWWVASTGVTKDGFTTGNSAGNTMQPNLHALCDWIIADIAKREGQHSFDEKAREQAWAEPHDFVKGLGD